MTSAVTVRVRPATPDDLDGCLDVFEEVVNEGRWLGAEPPIDRERRRERILEQIGGEQSTYLVAVAVARGDEGEGEGEVVGHLGLEVAPYGVAQFGMCVARAWRGRGVGTALVQEAVATARDLGAHKVALQVWPHNQPARRLYRRLGFVEEGRLRRHYPRRSGELWDAVVMGLVLDEERPGSSFSKEGDATDG